MDEWSVGFQLPYDITVPEDTEIGTTVFNGIRITDADSVGANIEIQCENVHDYPGACDVFGVETINSTANHYEGFLILKQKLNYNQQHLYEFVLRATVGVSFKKESYSA